MSKLLLQVMDADNVTLQHTQERIVKKFPNKMDINNANKMEDKVVSLIKIVSTVTSAMSRGYPAVVLYSFVLEPKGYYR